MPSASGDASVEWNSSKNYTGITAVSLLKYHGKPLLISPLVSFFVKEKYECSNRRLGLDKAIIGANVASEHA